MTKQKIEIDAPEDIKPLFEELCALINKKPNEVRTEILKFKGPVHIINARTIEPEHILAICKHAGFEYSFHMKVSYSVVKDEPPVHIPEKYEGMKVSDLHIEMEKQKEAIVNDGFIGNPENKTIVGHSEVLPGEIPDFN